MLEERTLATPTRRPQKLANDNPLWLHKGTGQWCKKIKGRFHDFGEDLQDALRKYDEQKALREAGIIPSETAATLADDPTIAEVCPAGPASQDATVEAGELSPRTFREQAGTCKDTGCAPRSAPSCVIADAAQLRASPGIARYEVWSDAAGQ